MAKKGQIKEVQDRVDRILQTLQTRPESSIVWSWSEVAAGCGLPWETIEQLISKKTLTDRLIVLGQDADSPLALSEHVDRLPHDSKVWAYLADRVRSLRESTDKPLRQPAAKFISDAKVPKAIQSPLLAELERRVQANSLGPQLEPLVQRPILDADLRQQLEQWAAEARVPSQQELANHFSLSTKELTKLLNDKSIQTTILPLSKEPDSLVFLMSQLGRLVGIDAVWQFMAARVREKRGGQNKPLLQSPAKFFTDVKLPKPLLPAFQAELERRLQANQLGAALAALIERPLTVDEVVNRMIELATAARGTHRYPIAAVDLATSLASVTNKTVLSQANKHLYFQQHMVACRPPGAKAYNHYLLVEDVQAADEALIFMALESAIAASAKPSGRTAAKPSHAFSAAKLATALFSDKSAREQFTHGLVERADRGELGSEIASLLVAGEQFYFRLQDLTNRPAFSPTTPSAAKPHPVTTPVPAAARTARVVDFASAFDAAFQQLDQQHGRRNYLQVLDLRTALPQFDRGTFDAELRQLRLAGRYTMDSAHGGYTQLTDAQRAAGIQEGSSLMIYVSRKTS